jgi:integrase
MRVFKQTYQDTAGNPHEHRRWTVEFTDHRGQEHRFAAFTDKAASEGMGHKLEQLADCRASNKLPDASLLAWADSLPAARREKLIKYGLLSSRSQDAGKTLLEHLADYGAHLASKGNTAEYVATARARIEAVLAATGARHWTELNPAAVRDYLAGRRNAPRFVERVDPKSPDAPPKIVRNPENLSAASSGHYVTALKGLCRWMVIAGRAAESPVISLERAKADVVHERRALTVKELHGLLDAAAGGPERFGMTGPERAMLYRLAAETGLRAKELRSLKRFSFDLAGSPPTVTIEGAYSKNRRTDEIPLRPDTAEALKAFIAGKMPATAVFNLPAWLKPIKVFKQDLEAAGIVYRDAGGRVADFHSLRHTFITNLARGGVHPKTAQALARHSTITLTMDRYSHSYLGDEASAVATLPDLSDAARQRATTRAAVGAEYTPEYSPPTDAERGAPVAVHGRSRPAAAGECGQKKKTGNASETAAFAGQREVSEWRGRRGSNPQPPDRQSGTLTN